VEARALLAETRVGARPRCLDVADDGALVAVGAAEGVVVLDASSLSPLHRIAYRAPRGEAVCAARFSPGSSYLALGTSAGAVDVVDVHGRASLARWVPALPAPHATSWRHVPQTLRETVAGNRSAASGAAALLSLTPRPLARARRQLGALAGQEVAEAALEFECADGVLLARLIQARSRPEAGPRFPFSARRLSEAGRGCGPGRQELLKELSGGLGVVSLRFYAANCEIAPHARAYKNRPRSLAKARPPHVSPRPCCRSSRRPNALGELGKGKCRRGL
jgi:hypothetical protein